MRKIALFCCLLFTLPIFAQAPSAPEAKPAAADTHYYHLEFVLKELGDDGKVVNSRNYHTTVATDHSFSNVRTGTRIPIHTNDKGGDIQYVDIGVNIDCNNVQDLSGELSLTVTADVSSLANPSSTSDGSMPIIRQNRWRSDTVLPIGKPTIVFSSDNLENKGRMEVEVTATQLH